MLCTTSDDQLFFSPLCFQGFIIIYVNVKINIHFIDMKRHMLICLFISMLMDFEKYEIVLKWR